MFNSREEWNKYKQKFNSCLPFFLSFNWHGHMVNKSHLVGPTAASTTLHCTALHGGQQAADDLACTMIYYEVIVIATRRQ